jgi:hypothetical protein
MDCGICNAPLADFEWPIEGKPVKMCSSCYTKACIAVEAELMSAGLVTYTESEKEKDDDFIAAGLFWWLIG